MVLSLASSLLFTFSCLYPSLGLSPPPRHPPLSRSLPTSPRSPLSPPSWCAPSSGTSSFAEISRAERRAASRRRRPWCVQSSPRAGCGSAARVPRCKPTASTAEVWLGTHLAAARQLVPARRLVRVFNLAYKFKATPAALARARGARSAEATVCLYLCGPSTDLLDSITSKVQGSTPSDGCLACKFLHVSIYRGFRFLGFHMYKSMDHSRL